MENYLKGKVIVITGAAGGFGKIVSEKSAAMGANVVCADINEEMLKSICASISDAGGSVTFQVTDVRSSEQMNALATHAVNTFGSIDVWINNAGTMPLAFYSDHKEASPAWDRCIDINFKGVLNGIIAAYDQMIDQGRGHIINLSSIYSNFPVVGAGVYGATKAAVNFLSESLRVESQGKIKVTTIKPTGVPATGLGAGIINGEAVIGILGQNGPVYMQSMQAQLSGELPPEQIDVENIEYYALEPEYLADQIIYTMNQPWGVAISDVTVRAAGDRYIL
ncbi:MAG: SDR family oxidoreductase [Pseudomonadales bacterium]